MAFRHAMSHCHLIRWHSGKSSEGGTNHRIKRKNPPSNFQIFGCSHSDWSPGTGNSRSLRPALRKFSAADIRQLRRDRRKGIPFQKLAQLHGTSVWTAFQICKRRLKGVLCVLWMCQGIVPLALRLRAAISEGKHYLASIRPDGWAFPSELRW